MLVNLLKSKIHRATVTDCHLHYEGSIGIDRVLMDAAGFIPYEQVDIYNINNGERLTTYVIEEKADSGIISIRGSAARKAETGDLIIICSYCQMNLEEAKKFIPTKIKVNEKNKIK